MKKIFLHILVAGGMVSGGILGAAGAIINAGWQVAALESAAGESGGGAGSAGTTGGTGSGGGSADGASGSSDTGGSSSEKEGPKLPEIYIKAVNPGYTVEGVQNVGEMIELGRTNSDEPISLAGLSIGYTNSSGKEAVLVEFSEHSFWAGETILLRLASSPGSELANLNYIKTLAMKAGPLTLRRGEEVLDEVCWTGKDECVKEFKSAKPTTLVRDLETGGWEHMEEYEPKYAEENYYIEVVESDGEVEGVEAEEAAKAVSQCRGVQFSEILSYYAEAQTEQFVELYNAGAEQVLLDGCALRYKNKTYPLAGIMVAEGHYARYATDFKLTKNPTNSNTLELIDADGTVLDKLEYPNGQRKGTSYAWIGYDEGGDELWRVTYAVTPGEPNIYQEYKTCEEGKVINEATGNCVKVTMVAEKTCAEGQYLNPLTGRCRKYEITSTSSTECKEGYYYYEATGRCRKIQENTGADYTLVPETYEEESSFVGLYAVAGVGGVGVVYVIYEFRKEIGRFVRRLLRRA